jgi:hypothetical protein
MEVVMQNARRKQISFIFVILFNIIKQSIFPNIDMHDNGPGVWGVAVCVMVGEVFAKSREMGESFVSR